MNKFYKVNSIIIGVGVAGFALFKLWGILGKGWDIVEMFQAGGMAHLGFKEWIMLIFFALICLFVVAVLGCIIYFLIALIIREFKRKDE